MTAIICSWNTFKQELRSLVSILFTNKQRPRRPRSHSGTLLTLDTRNPNPPPPPPTAAVFERQTKTAQSIVKPEVKGHRTGVCKIKDIRIQRWRSFPTISNEMIYLGHADELNHLHDDSTHDFRWGRTRLFSQTGIRDPQWHSDLELGSWTISYPNVHLVEMSSWTIAALG